MANENPTEKSLQTKEEVCLVKVQTQVSAKHNSIKKDKPLTGQNKKLKKTAEMLMDHWGVYYY